MAKTRIEWADRVWNPVTGCSPVSAGCENCYARDFAHRLLRGKAGYPADDPFRVTVHMDKLEQPLRWRKPGRVFVNSMSDLFHPDVPDDIIQQVFTTMSLSNGKFLILTKRPERMMTLLSNSGFQEGVTYVECDEGAGYLPWPLPNIWLGVSAENQQTADERIPLLLQTPAALRFVSCEPLLGPVELDNICISGTREGTGDFLNALSLEDWTESEARAECGENYMPPLNWVIAGRETGPNARPCNSQWIADIVAQCRAAVVPVFVKPPFADEHLEFNIQEFPRG